MIPKVSSGIPNPEVSVNISGKCRVAGPLFCDQNQKYFSQIPKTCQPSNLYPLFPLFWLNYLTVFLSPKMVYTASVPPVVTSPGWGN